MKQLTEARIADLTKAPAINWRIDIDPTTGMGTAINPNDPTQRTPLGRIREPAPSQTPLVNVPAYTNEQGQTVTALRPSTSPTIVPGSERPVPPPAEPKPKPPTRTERRDAAYAARAAVSAQTLEVLEQTNAASVRKAAIAINRPNFARLIPFIGNRSEKAVKALREVGLDDDAIRYLNALVEFATNAAPAQFTPGALRSPEMLYNMWVEFGAQPGEGPAGWKIKQRNRKNLVRGTAFSAGDAWEEVLKEFPEVDAQWLMTDSTSLGGYDPSKLEGYRNRRQP